MTVVNDSSPSRQGARARALIIGIICSAITAVVVMWAEMVISQIKPGYLNFPPAALGLLMVVIAVNRLIRLIAKRAALDSSDLLVIYCMILVATMVASHGVVEKLVPLLAITNYYADNNNNWNHLFNPHIRPELMPWDVRLGNAQDVTAWYYNKLPRDTAMPWQLWVRPLLCWTSLIGLVLGAYLCLTAIVRKQWVDNEKLAFPLAQLPMDMAADEEQHKFWTNKLMWLGILIPVLVYTAKGFHQLYPTVPDIILQYTLTDYLKTAPWTGIGPMYFLISFAAIGFFYLLPADVLFSIWFFFILSKAAMFWSIQYNIDSPQMPQFGNPIWLMYQTVGGSCALVTYFIWIARPHLKRVFAAAMGDKSIDDSEEILSYRTAFWGLIACVLGGAAWLIWAGMSWWVAGLEMVGSIFFIALIMARSTAEGGMLLTEASFSPIDLYRMFAPMHNLGPANLTMIALFQSLVPLDQRAVLLTGMMDASRITDGTKVRRRSFGVIFIVGMAVAFVVAVCMNVYWPYIIGGTNMDGWLENGSSRWKIAEIATYFPATAATSPTAHWQMPVFFIVGIVVTIFLTAMRSTFYWWPLHPLGYVLMGGWGVVEIWFAALIAWIFKTLTIRYGGMGLYTKARPFFLGMVIGEFGMMVFYAMVSIIAYQFFHHTKFPVPAFPWL